MREAGHKSSATHPWPRHARSSQRHSLGGRASTAWEIRCRRWLGEGRGSVVVDGVVGQRNSRATTMHPYCSIYYKIVRGTLPGNPSGGLMTTVVLRHAEVLVTMDPARREIRDGGMIIRDGVIEAVAPTHELPTVMAA